MSQCEADHKNKSHFDEKNYSSFHSGTVFLQARQLGGIHLQEQGRQEIPLHRELQGACRVHA